MAFPDTNPESSSARDVKSELSPRDEVKPRGEVNDDKERWRLAWHYGEMADGELASLAAESSSLTDVARRALQYEIDRRRLSVEWQEVAASAKAASGSDNDKTALAAKTGATGKARSASATNAAKSGGIATVRRFRDMPEALLAKSVLESAGIDCLLGDANIIRTDWLWSNMLGGIKLRVQEEDLAEATRLLDQEPFDQEPPDGSAIPGGPLQDAGEFVPPCCPRCQSLDVTFDNLRASAAAPRAISNAAPALEESAWICLACGNQWRELEPTG